MMEKWGTSLFIFQLLLAQKIAELAEAPAAFVHLEQLLLHCGRQRQDLREPRAYPGRRLEPERLLYPRGLTFVDDRLIYEASDMRVGLFQTTEGF